MTETNKKPTECVNTSAGMTEQGQILGACSANDKEFSTLRAQAALRGHGLHRSSPQDGPVIYWVTRWGVTRDLPNIDAVRAFIRQIGCKA